MSHWTTEHWISIGSRIWQQGGVGSQTASAYNIHDYQNETFNINPFWNVRSQSESENYARNHDITLHINYNQLSLLYCEAQLSFPKVYLKKEKQRCRIKLPLLTYSDHKVTFTNPKLTNKVSWSNPNLTNIEPVITSSDPTVTYSDLYSDL